MMKLSLSCILQYFSKKELRKTKEKEKIFWIPPWVEANNFELGNRAQFCRNFIQEIWSNKVILNYIDVTIPSHKGKVISLPNLGILAKMQLKANKWYTCRKFETRSKLVCEEISSFT